MAGLFCAKRRLVKVVSLTTPPPTVRVARPLMVAKNQQQYYLGLEWAQQKRGNRAEEKWADQTAGFEDCLKRQMPNLFEQIIFRQDSKLRSNSAHFTERREVARNATDYASPLRTKKDDSLKSSSLRCVGDSNP